jgi:hypothetical protein
LAEGQGRGGEGPRSEQWHRGSEGGRWRCRRWGGGWVCNRIKDFHPGLAVLSYPTMEPTRGAEERGGAGPRASDVAHRFVGDELRSIGFRFRCRPRCFEKISRSRSTSPSASLFLTPSDVLGPILIRRGQRLPRACLSLPHSTIPFLQIGSVVVKSTNVDHLKL